MKDSNVIVLPRIRTKAERDYMPWVDAFGKRGEDGKLTCYARCYDCGKLSSIADPITRTCRKCYEGQK